MDGQAHSYANGVKYICHHRGYDSLPNHHQIIAQRVLVSLWDRYDDILFEITELHVIKNVA